MSQPRLEGVSRETQAHLEQYHALLLKWQERINLISPNTVKDSWNRHFVDSVQLLDVIPPDTKVLYDLGSGAGFPGMVLALARPDIEVTLIESDAKKCAFLQTVSRETGVKVSISNQRIEAATAQLEAPDIVTARALAALETLLEYCHPWLQKRLDLKFIFPKGEQASAEISAAKAAGWAFDCIEKVSKTDTKARILILNNVTKTKV